MRSKSAPVIEQRVIHLRDRAHGDSGQSESASFAQDAKSGRNEGAGRSEDDGAIERVGRCVLGAAYPSRAQSCGEIAMRLGTSEDVDFAAPVASELQDEVRRGSETVKAQTSAGADIA